MPHDGLEPDPSLSRAAALQLRQGWMLPLDIERHEHTLRATRANIVGFVHRMEHMFFGVVGLDPMISLVPIVGDAAASLLCLWLLVLGHRVRLPAGDKAIIVGLAAVDFAVGCVPAVGDVLDVFFRGHAWGAARIIQHIDIRLALITAARQQLAARHDEPSDADPTLVRLRDALFRDGRTEKQVSIRLLAIAGACLALLSYCGFNSYLRNQNIAACEARGGWFCNTRY